MKTPDLLPSGLIGAACSARSLLPLALVSATSAGLPAEGRPLLSRPVARAGLGLLAMGELWGDKLGSAPDRTVPPGLLARAATGALAGGAVAASGRRTSGAWLGAGVAVLMSFATLAGRKRAIGRIGQTPSGLIEDALVLGLASAAVGLALRRT
jgi:uncharacterized membrane protein